MSGPELHVVTGAFGYCGRYIAARLLSMGLPRADIDQFAATPQPVLREGRGLTRGTPTSRRQLRESLRGASVLYNTYWVRFNHGEFGFSDCRAEQPAALRGGPRRRSPARGPRQHHEPFRGLAAGIFPGQGAAGTRAARIGPVSRHPAARRPLRRRGHPGQQHRLGAAPFPVFAVFGDGQYRLQPIYVDDFAEQAVAGGAGPNAHRQRHRPGDVHLSRPGRRSAGRSASRGASSRSPPSVAYAATWLTGKIVHDVIITREEIKGLMAGLLCADSPPLGKIRLSAWARSTRTVSASITPANSPGDSTGAACISLRQRSA